MLVPTAALDGVGPRILHPPPKWTKLEEPDRTCRPRQRRQTLHERGDDGFSDFYDVVPVRPIGREQVRSCAWASRCSSDAPSWISRRRLLPRVPSRLVLYQVILGGNDDAKMRVMRKCVFPQFHLTRRNLAVLNVEIFATVGGASGSQSLDTLFR